MAQIPLTGGDGSSGQSGLSSREAINANDAELYGYTAEEFERAWTAIMLFDKPLVVYAPTNLADDVNFSLDGTGHLVNRSSLAIQTITTDGTYAFNFSADFSFTYGISNGQILEAGTYEFYFLYINGSVRVNVPGVTAQDSSLIPLSAPTNFEAVADGQDEIDLSWDAVSGATGYLIQYSLDGSTGWSALSTPGAGDTTASQSGLSAGDVRYYRIKAIGDGVSSSDSSYSSSSGVTDTPAGSPPSFTFNPLSGVNTWPVNSPITITADTPIRKTDGTDLTDANIASVLTVKQTNSGGANISFTATINVGKTLITITPATSFGSTQLVYVAINNVEAISNSEEVTVAVSNTFTTTGYTSFNGTSNAIVGGDILDTLFTVNDAQFKLKITLWHPSTVGTHMLINKYATASNQRSFYFYTTDDDVFFAWSHAGVGANRAYRWNNPLNSSEATYQLEYDGSVDTNNGIDRVVLKKNGSSLAAPTAITVTGVLDKIFNSTAQTAFGAGVNESGVVEVPLYYAGEAKDLIIMDWSNVEIVNIPNLREGTDVSGNGHHMTWLS